MIAARAWSVLIGCALASALSACGGGGHVMPDGGDGSVDVGRDGPDGGDDGGGNPNAIVVDTPSGVVATDSQDGFCDIIEAVAAAASGKSVRECANPNGVTHVRLKPGYAYPVGKTLHLGGGTEIGLPDGATEHATISAVAGFAADTGNPSSSCLVLVNDSTNDVWLRDVTLTQAPGPVVTGACVTKGALDLRRVRVTGFGAGGLSATCLPASGCDHEADSGAATTLRVLGSSIDGNHSSGKGAGIASEGSGATIYVSHSAIVDNASDNDGGGVYLGGGWGTDIIQSSTVSGNSSNGVGGGVLVRFAETTWTYFYLLNSTVANNVASGTGGGIEFEPAELGAQDISLYSSIVAANFSVGTLEWNINAGWNRPDNPPVFNCVQRSFVYVAPGYPRPTDSGSCVFDVRNPLLGPLMPLGGGGDLPLHPLLAGSPAIDGAPADTTPDQQRDDWIHDFDPATPPDWTLFDPLVDGDGDGTPVRDIGAYERNDRWQAELLAVRAQGASGVTVVTIPDGYDRGAGATYAATSATAEFVTYALPIGEAGRYDVSVRARTDGGAGKFQLAIADDPAGPWTPLGAEQDSYAAASTFASFGPFQTPVFATAGEKLLRFTVTGKNAASSGFKLNLDYVDARRSTAACAVVNVAAGGNDTCVLLANKGVRCWGADGQGQLGDGNGTDRASPLAIDVAADVTAVATGSAHTCVLSSDGGVRCWGANARGQLGDGTTTARATPPGAAVLTGVESDRGGPRVHLRADDRRRGPLLGRQRVRPARRRNDGRSPDAAGHGRDLGRPGDRDRRRAHLCPDDRRRRSLLGRQRPGPARRRNDDQSPDGPARRRRRRDGGGQRRRHPHLRADERGRRPLLGTQPGRRAGHRQLRHSHRAAQHGRPDRRQAGGGGQPVHLRAADDGRRPLLGLEQPRRDRRRHRAAGRSPKPRGGRRPRRRGQPRRGVHPRLRAHDRRRRALLGRQRIGAARGRPAPDQCAHASHDGRPGLHGDVPMNPAAVSTVCSWPFNPIGRYR